MYLITSCASCAAPLDGGVKQCSRCKTRYCSASCQRDHWKKRGGHKTECAEIALVYQARREREEKESREQSAKWAADYSRDEWKGRTRRKKGESPNLPINY